MLDLQQEMEQRQQLLLALTLQQHLQQPSGQALAYEFIPY